MNLQNIKIVDTTSAISEMLNDLRDLPTKSPSLYLDLEGINLGRNGTISIITLYVPPWSTIYLLDIFTLGSAAFSTPGPKSKTFRSILESASIPKAFFGCRSDLDALYALFRIKMGGVIDIQLLEVAQREGEKRDRYDRLLSLLDCINKDFDLGQRQKEDMKLVKDGGKGLFAPVCGGSYEVFNERPMRREIIEYCAQDVTLLPMLWLRYSQKIAPEWAAKVEVETEKLIQQSQDVDLELSEESKRMSP